MNLQWVHETPAVWDEVKGRVLGAAAPGTFRFGGAANGDLLPGEWWRVVDGDRVVGYGWMDINWADGEVLVAVDPAVQRQGVGSFILSQLEREAHTRGVNYLYNVVPPGHPDPARLAAWLERHGYVAHGNGLMRAAIGRQKTSA